MASPLSRASCIFIALIITTSAYCQSDEFDTFHVYFNGEIAVPSPEFAKAVNNDWGNLGVGLSGGALFNPLGKRKASPILLGADFNYITFGVDKIGQTPYSPPLKTTFNVYTISGAARLLFHQRKGFAPFADGMIGMKIFNTRTKVDKDFLDLLMGNNYPETVSTTNDNSLNYGVGLGFFLRNHDKDGFVAASFSMRVMYVWGAKANYVIRDSVQFDSNYNLTYQKGTTMTDMVQVQLGFVVF